MTGWTVFTLVSMLIVAGLGIYNIRSLVRKWKANPKSWFDLLVGIVIWTLALCALAYIGLQQAGVIG